MTFVDIAREIAKAIREYDPYCGQEDKELFDGYCELLKREPEWVVDEMQTLADEIEEDDEILKSDREAFLRIVGHIENMMKDNREESSAIIAQTDRVTIAKSIYKGRKWYSVYFEGYCECDMVFNKAYTLEDAFQIAYREIRKDDAA